jgi:hypothetical protein
MTQYFATHPLFLLCAAIVAVVLLGLTMRSIIRRDKAMINVTMDKPADIETYKQHWRPAA